MVVMRGVESTARGIFVDGHGSWRKGRLATLGVVVLVAAVCLERALRMRLRREVGRSDEESTLWFLRTGEAEGGGEESTLTNEDVSI